MRSSFARLILPVTLSLCAVSVPATGQTVLPAPTARDSAHAVTDVRLKAARDDVTKYLKLTGVPGYAKRGWAKLVVAESLLVYVAPKRDSVPSQPPVVTPPATPIHYIALTPSSATLKIGQTVQVEGVPRDDKGTALAIPVTWRTASTVASVVTGSATTAALTGRTVGTTTLYATADTVTRSIAVTVVDSAAPPVVVVPPDTTKAPPPTPTALGPAELAELPRAVPPRAPTAASRSVKVCPNACSLQAAIDAATPGTELLLAPGATYVGPFTLRNKGEQTAWITFRTDTAISAPSRMTPTAAKLNRLAKLVTPGANQSVIVTELGANHYAFVGVEITTASTDDVNSLVAFGSSYPEQTAANTAHHLIVAWSWVHGVMGVNLRRCFAANSAWTSVVDSWVENCVDQNSDSQAFLAYNGPGPFLIENNYLSAGHEIVMFGGGSFTVTGGRPSDITIRGNHITRPLSYLRVGGVTVPGVTAVVKNLIETKNADHVLIEGNVIENNWGDAQSGFAFVWKSENQNNDNPWTTSAHITMRYNRVRCVGNVFNVSAHGSSPSPNIPANHFSIYDNVVERVNVPGCQAQGIAVQLLGGLSDLYFAHNSVANGGSESLGSNSFLSFDGEPAPRMTFSANVLYNGEYGAKGSGGSPGTSSLNTFAPGAGFVSNAIVGDVCSWYPAGQVCSPAWPTTLGLAPDGRPIGPDIARVNAATKNAVVAP